MTNFQVTFWSLHFKRMATPLSPKLPIKSTSLAKTLSLPQKRPYRVTLDGRAIYLSMYDLEKAFDSVEHCILLQSLFHAGINGKAQRLIRACYSNLTAVVKLKSTLSDLFPITRGVQQGSVLSPVFFLVVMDRLLQRLRETSSGMSICSLYLGGAAHADDVRVLASSAAVAEEQGQIIHSFATENGLKLNCEKTEVVKIYSTI